MTFSRFFTNIANYSRIFLILGLIVLAGVGSQIGGISVYAGTVDNKCAKEAPVIRGSVQVCSLRFDNGTSGIFNTEATFIENPTTKKLEFAGLENCYIGADKSKATGNNCGSFALAAVNIGDDISVIKEIKENWAGSAQMKFKILNPNAVGSDAKNFDGNTCKEEFKLDNDHILYNCGQKDYVIQNLLTGKYSTYASDTFDTDTIKEKFKSGEVKGKNGEYFKKSTLGGLAPSQIGDLKPEQIALVNAVMASNQKIIDTGDQSTPKIPITCEVPRLDEKGNVTSSCKGSDGKYYNFDKDGKFGVLADKCIGTTSNKTGDIVDPCLTEAKNKEIAARPENKTLQPIKDAIANEKAATNNLSGKDTNSIADMIKSIGALVGWVLFFLIYFFGWILSFVLYFISVLFVEILSINPAAPAFIGAAVRPWQVLVGLANLMVLGTFIAIGLGYILNYTPLKRNIREFILQIAVFALLLQFSLLGTGVVVNLATGIGDAMVYSYAGSVKKTGRPNYSRLIGGFVKAINNISAVRCGKAVEPTKKAEFCDVNVASVPFETDGKNENGVANIGDALKNVGTFVGDTSKPAENFLTDAGAQGKLLQYLLFESIFVLVMFYGIIQMFQAFGLVIFRLVGLWMLMVTSPVALALYLAPVKSMNKYATEWLDKFWKATFFYPFFILALVLHTKLVSAIAVALNVGQTLSKTDGGDVSPISMAVIVAAGTLAGVSIVGLALVIKWFKDSFGAIIDAAMKGLGKAFGALKMASYGAGTVLKGAGGLANKMGVGNLGLGSVGRVIGKTANWATQGNAGQLAKSLGSAIGSQGRIGAGVMKGFNGLGNALNGATVGNALGGVGNVFDFLPTTFDTGMALGKDAYETVTRMGKAKIARNVQGQLGNVELAARRMGLGGILDNSKRLKTLEGETADSIAEDEGNARMELANAENKAYDDINGKKFEDTGQARRKYNRLKDQINTQGAKSLSTTQLADFKRLAARAASSDSTMFEEMVSDTNTRQLLTDVMSSMDSTTRTKFEEQELLGLTDQQKTSVVSAWSGKDILNKLNNRMLLDPVVQAALRDNINITDEDLDAKIRAANQSNIGVIANERARDTSNILSNPTAMSAFNQGVANNARPLSTAAAATFSQASNQIYAQTTQANGAIPTEDEIRTTVTATYSANMDAQYGRGVGNLRADSPNFEAQLTDIYKNMPLAELVKIPDAIGITQTPAYQKLNEQEKQLVVQEFLSVNTTRAVANSTVDLNSLVTAVAQETKARVVGENSSKANSYTAGVFGSYIGTGASIDSLKNNTELGHSLAIPPIVDNAVRAINNQSGKMAGFDMDMSTVAVSMQSQKDRDKLTQQYKDAVLEFQKTGNRTAFKQVETTLTKANGGVAVNFDTNKFTQERTEKATEKINETFLGKQSTESVDQFLSRTKVEYSDKAKSDTEKAAQKYRNEIPKVYNPSNTPIKPIKVSVPQATRQPVSSNPNPFDLGQVQPGVGNASGAVPRPTPTPTQSTPTQPTPPPDYSAWN